jgi:hypothetical protein
MNKLKSILEEIQYLKSDIELWIEYSIELTYNWFFVPMPEGDWYYYWGLFADWQGTVNPNWYDLDVDEQTDLFYHFWFHKINRIINKFRY